MTSPIGSSNIIEQTLLNSDIKEIDPCKVVQVMLRSLPEARTESHGGKFISSKHSLKLPEEEFHSFDKSTIDLLRAHLACEKGYVGLAIPGRSSPIYTDEAHLPQDKQAAEESLQKERREQQQIRRMKRRSKDDCIIA